MEDSDSDSPPPVTRPEKNINIFISDENIGVFPPGVYDGEMGDLPLLISVNVGYDPEDKDPYMCHYESQEIMFAYKKGAQKRVLLRDSRSRTLSLPLHSSLPFHVVADSKEMTMAQIVSSHDLPVSVQFARTDCLDIIVDKRAADHQFFGSMTVYSVYEEPYLWCLAVAGNGKTSDKPIVLPRNLSAAGFCPVVGVRGVNDPAAKVKEFIHMYSQAASQLDFDGDPFFQELAFVSRGPEPVETIEPYIDNTTFIPIRVNRRPAPLAPDTEPPPPPPPRSHLRQQSSAEEKEESHYCSISPKDGNEHVYAVVKNEDIKFVTGFLKPFKHLKVHAFSEASQKPPEKTGLSTPLGKGSELPDKSSLGRFSKKPPAENKAPRDPPAPPPVARRQGFLDSRSRSSDESQRFNVSLMTPAQSTVKPRLDDLSVEDVAAKLKELGLGKYAKKFRKNRIDGVLLPKLSEENLKSEFNMTHMEFLVLHTFVTEGHIPQMASKSSSKATI